MVLVRKFRMSHTNSNMLDSSGKRHKESEPAHGPETDVATQVREVLVSQLTSAVQADVRTQLAMAIKETTMHLERALKDLTEKWVMSQA